MIDDKITREVVDNVHVGPEIKSCILEYLEVPTVKSMAFCSVEVELWRMIWDEQ